MHVVVNSVDQTLAIRSHSAMQIANAMKESERSQKSKPPVGKEIDPWHRRRLARQTRAIDQIVSVFEHYARHGLNELDRIGIVAIQGYDNFAFARAQRHVHSGAIAARRKLPDHPRSQRLRDFRSMIG